MVRVIVDRHHRIVVHIDDTNIVTIDLDLEAEVGAAVEAVVEVDLVHDHDAALNVDAEVLVTLKNRKKTFSRRK